jgi:peptidoglycan hydrolase-like protein with peptidoglycan-binding domain
MSRPWRVAGSLLVLFDEVNKRWPDRDKASDGTIGNAAHAANWTGSDHNPWVVVDGVGVVRAGDIDSGPGLNPDDAHDVVGDTVAEAARQAGLSGHPAMGPGSYVIHERQIASANSSPPWSWRPYTGADPHTSHPHISVTTNPAGFDSTRPWGVWPPVRKHPPTIRRNGPHHRAWTRKLQGALGLTVDGYYGPKTARRVAVYRLRHGILPVSGTAGPRVWKRLGLW